MSRLLYRNDHFYNFIARQASIFYIEVEMYSEGKQIPNFVLRTGASGHKPYKLALL